MNFRSIIIGIDNDFAYIDNHNSGNWTDYHNRSYRKDKKANLQVINEDGTLKGIVEAIYFEGIAAPVNSSMTETEITAQIFKEVHSFQFAKPRVSFWDKLFKRN